MPASKLHPSGQGRHRRNQSPAIRQRGWSVGIVDRMVVNPPCTHTLGRGGGGPWCVVSLERGAGTSAPHNRNFGAWNPWSRRCVQRAPGKHHAPKPCPTQKRGDTNRADRATRKQTAAASRILRPSNPFGSVQLLRSNLPASFFPGALCQ